MATPLLLLVLVACGESSGSLMDMPGPPLCDQANLGGVPIVALEWSALRETYLAPDHGFSNIGIDYMVSPRAQVDAVELRFDFDPLVSTEEVSLEGECLMMFPLEPLLTSLPPESEDVVSATVVASSTSGSARTGRIVASTGSSTIEIRTAGLDAGDPENGNWWAIFEPAAGRARLVIAPATLDRDTFSLSGVPTDQPGIVALIQTPALEIDAATQTVYAPWGFAGDWRRYASAWYQTVLWQPMAGLVELRAVVAPEHDLAQVHSTEPNTVLAAGAERQFRVLPARAERILNVPCDVPVVRVEVLNFGEVIAEGDATLRPAEAGTFTGSCAAGDASWPLRLLARSLNGRAVGVLLQSLPDEVMP